MSQNMPLYLVASAAAGIVSKVALDVPVAFSGILSVAVFGVCLGVTSFLKVEIPKAQPKPKKISKKEKRLLAAANAVEDEPSPEDDKKALKAAKKREKERAKKEAKKEAEKQKAAAAKAEKEEKEAELKAVKGDEKKKAKKKAKKKKPTVPEKAASEAKVEKETEEEAKPVAAPTGTDSWEKVKVKNPKKKKVEVAEDDEEEPAYTMDVLVEKKAFGTIIGEGGSTLRRIMELTNVQIDIPKDGIRRDIILTGEPADCAKAKSIIKQLASKGYSDSLDAVTSINVPNRKRAVLIGPGGKNIKAIQLATKTRINMPEKGSDSDEVTVVGDAENVKVAMEAITQLLDKGYCSLTHENHTDDTIEVPQSALKTLIGAGGSTIKGLQEQHSVRINVPSGSDEVVFVSVIGDPANIAACRAQIAELLKPPPPVPIAPEWTQAASLAHLDAW